MGVPKMVVPPFHTPKWSFLVGKPIVVGYHHFRKPPYIHVCILVFLEWNLVISWLSSSCAFYTYWVLESIVKFCYKKIPGEKHLAQHIHKETHVHIYAHEYREAGIDKQND